MVHLAEGVVVSRRQSKDCFVAALCQSAHYGVDMSRLFPIATGVYRSCVWYRTLALREWAPAQKYNSPQLATAMAIREYERPFPHTIW